MKYAIIISKLDIAGMNIYGKIKNKFENIILLDEDTIYAENIDKKIDADLFIFCTRHKSESGVPSLSVHSPGNFGKAMHGGRDKTLCLAPAIVLKNCLRLLEKNKIEGFEVIQEVTHHGPYLEKPSIFLEIGSSENEWGNNSASDAISKVLTELINSLDESNYRTAFGIGGPHHTPNFKKIQLESDIAIGHVCPKYNLENLDKGMILQALEKTIPKADLVILDWKGLGEHKDRLTKILDEINVEVKKTKDY